MKKGRGEKLEQLLVLRERDCQEALRGLLEIQSQFSGLQQRHAQLQQYREEYVAQLNSLGSTGCRLGQMKNRIDFITQLEKALQQLNQQLAQLAKKRQQAQQVLNKAKMAEKSIQKLLERRQAEAEQQLNRHAQKESDAFAQRQCYSKKY